MTNKPSENDVAPRENNEIIGIRLPKEVVLAVKQEVARRGIKLNHLFLELWEDYEKRKGK
jgi:predicted DNA binding CopG/RHH family protein